MKTEKISDELLSWVFGCECEFDKIDNYNNGATINFNSESKKARRVKGVDKIKMNGWGKDGEGAIEFHYISLYEFIHLAKIKAFEAGYGIYQQPFYTDVLNISGEKHETFKSIELYGVTGIIEAIEWVCSEVLNG